MWYLDSVPSLVDEPLDKSAPDYQNPCNPGHWKFSSEACTFRASVDFCASDVPWEKAKDCQISLPTETMTITAGPILLPKSTAAKYTPGEVLAVVNIAVKGNGATFNAGIASERYIATEPDEEAADRRLTAYYMHKEAAYEKRHREINANNTFRKTQESEDRRLAGSTARVHQYGTTNENKITFSNLTLNGFGSSSDGGAILVEDYSEVTIDSVTFVNNYALAGGAVYVTNATTVRISSSVFRGCRSAEGGGAVFLKNIGTVIIEDSTFTNNTANTVGGAVVIENCNVVHVKNTVFSANVAGYNGGGLSINKVALETLVQDSLFGSNTAYYGSSISLGRAANFSGFRNIFESNSHVSGATVYWIYRSYEYATGSPPAFLSDRGDDQWYQPSMSPPVLWESNTFTSNMESGLRCTKNISTEVIRTTTEPETLHITDFSYGGRPLDVKVYLADYYGHTIPTEPSSLVTLVLEESQHMCTFNEDQVRLYGNLLGVSRIGGYTEINGFGASCTPGGSMNITALSQLSKRSVTFPVYQVRSASEWLIVEASKRVAQSYIDTRFRLCAAGEYFHYDNTSRSACITCPYGKVSLKDNLEHEVTSCSSCPFPSNECYANVVDLREGTWRASNYSQIVAFCPLPDGCGGGTSYGEMSCTEGHLGPLCATCKDGYYLGSNLDGFGKCLPCSGAGSVSSSQIFCIFLLILLAVAIWYYREWAKARTKVGVAFETSLEADGSSVIDGANGTTKISRSEKQIRDEDVAATNTFGLTGLFVAKWVSRTKVLWTTYQMIVLFPSVLGFPIGPVFFRIVGMFQFINFDLLTFSPAGCGVTRWTYLDSVVVSSCIPVVLAILSLGYFHMRRTQRRNIFYETHPHYVAEHQDIIRRLDMMELERALQQRRDHVGDATEKVAAQWSYTHEAVSKGIKGFQSSQKVAPLTPSKDNPAGSTVTSKSAKSTRVDEGESKSYFSKVAPLSLKNAFEAVSSPSSKGHDEVAFAENKTMEECEKPQIQKLWTDHLPILHKFSDDDIMEMSSLTELEKTERKRLAAFAKHLLVISYFIQPAICLKIFGLFDCIDVYIDTSGIPARYLRADLSVSCGSSAYTIGVWFAVFMSLVYLVGLTTLYAYLLHRSRYLIQHRPDLQDSAMEELRDETEDLLDIFVTGGVKNRAVVGKSESKRMCEHHRMRRTVDTTHHTAVLLKRLDGHQGGNINQRVYKESRLQFESSRVVGDFEFEVMHFFYESYRPQFWYWELVEIVRRIIMCSALSVVAKGTRAQILLGFLLSVFFFTVHCRNQPYTDKLTNNMAKFGHFQHTFTLFFCLLVRNRVEISGGDAHFFLPSYDAFLCLTNSCVFVSFMYLLLRREMKSRLLLWTQRNGFVRLHSALSAPVLEEAVATEDQHGLLTIHKKKSFRSLTRRLKSNFEYGPAFTHQFSGHEVTEDVKWYFFYLKAAISHVYTFVLHERRMGAEIVDTGFIVESSDEEDSEPEFVPETEQTWLVDDEKTMDFLDNHLLFTPEGGLSDLWDSLGWASMMVEELVREVESELTWQLMADDVFKEVTAIVTELIEELTPAPDTVMKQAMSGSLLIGSRIYGVDESDESDESDEAVLETEDILDKDVVVDADEDKEAEPSAVVDPVDRQLDYDVSDSSSSDDDNDVAKDAHVHLQEELQAMSTEDKLTRSIINATKERVERKALRLAAKKDKLLKEKVARKAEAVKAEKRAIRDAEHEAARKEQEEKVRLEREKAEKEATYQLMLANETPAQKKKRLDKEKLLKEAMKRLELAKKQLELQAKKKAAEKAKEEENIAAQKEKERKRRKAVAIRLEKDLKAAEEKKKATEAKMAARAAREKRRKEAEAARLEARKQASATLTSKLNPKAKSIATAAKPVTSPTLTYDLSDSDNDAGDEKEKEDSEPSVNSDELAVSSIGSVSDSEEEREEKAKQEAAKSRTSLMSRMQKGNMLKMVSTKVMIMNTLGRTEGTKLSREQRYKQAESDLDRRRKGDEESLRVKAVNDALRREKMSELERGFAETNAKYEELMNATDEKERALLKPKAEEELRKQLAQDIHEIEPQYLKMKENISRLQAEEATATEEEREIVARLAVSLKEKDAYANKRKRVAEKEKARIAALIEADRNEHKEKMKGDKTAQLRKKLWEIEQSRLKEEEGMSLEEKKRRRERLEKKARLKAKAKAAHEERLRVANQAEEDRRKRVAAEEASSQGITGKLSIGEEVSVDRSGISSVAEMEDRKQKRAEREKKQRYALAKAGEVEREVELKAKRVWSNSKLKERLERRRITRLTEVSDTSETDESDSPVRIRPPLVHTKTNDELRVEEIQEQTDKASLRRETEIASAAEVGHENTKRRVEIIKRKKKVKKKFSAVLKRVSLMAKLGATFEEPIVEEEEDDDGEDEVHDAMGNVVTSSVLLASMPTLKEHVALPPDNATLEQPFATMESDVSNSASDADITLTPHRHSVLGNTATSSLFDVSSAEESDWTPTTENVHERSGNVAGSPPTQTPLSSFRTPPSNSDLNTSMYAISSESEADTPLPLAANNVEGYELSDSD